MVPSSRGPTWAILGLISPPKASRRAAPLAAKLAEEIDLNGRWKSEGETAGGLHSEEVLSAALPSTRKIHSAANL